MVIFVNVALTKKLSTPKAEAAWPGKKFKHSGENPQTFRECSQTFGGMWEKWLWDFVCVECLGLMIGLMLFLLVSFSSIWF